MFEYWQDAGARGKARSRSPKKSPTKKRSPVKKSLKKIGKIVTFKNGVKARWSRVEGKTVLRIVKGLSPRKFKSQVQAKRGKRSRMTKDQAKRAMDRYYRIRHTDPVERAIAVGRDMCGSNKPVVRSSKYKRSPLRYDFPGLDDGSQCDHKPTGRRRMSSKAKKALVARLQKGKRSAERKRANKANRMSKAARSAARKEARKAARRAARKSPRSSARKSRGKK